MIKKMKSLDVLTLVCIVFLMALVLVGEQTAGLLQTENVVVGETSKPNYLFVVELVILGITFFTMLINLRYKNKIRNNTNEIIRAVGAENYEDITESLIESFGSDIADGIENIIEDLESKNRSIRHVVELSRLIEKDEVSKFKLRELDIDSSLKHALRVFMKQTETIESSQKINTEFLKRIKSHKFTRIDVDDENVTEQQLNAILKSFEIIDTNIKNTQPALYEGDFNVEIEKIDIEKDYLNITSKLGTLLTSQKKSIINLYYAILMLEEFDHQEVISSSYKGNLVHNFRALETVYENLTVSIENIAYAIENKVNINYDNVSEIFRPIIDIINKDESFKNVLPEGVGSSKILEDEDEFDEKILKSKSNFENKHFTKNHELITDIEKRLNDMKFVFDDDLDDDDIDFEIDLKTDLNDKLDSNLDYEIDVKVEEKLEEKLEDTVEGELIETEEVTEEVTVEITEEIAEEIAEEKVDEIAVKTVVENVLENIVEDNIEDDSLVISEDVSVDLDENNLINDTLEDDSSKQDDIDEAIENSDDVVGFDILADETPSEVEATDSNVDLKNEADGELVDVENVNKNNEDELPKANIKNNKKASKNKHKAKGKEKNKTTSNNVENTNILSSNKYNDTSAINKTNLESVIKNSNTSLNARTNTTTNITNTINTTNTTNNVNLRGNLKTNINSSFKDSAKTNVSATEKFKSTQSKIKENKGGKRVNSITSDKNKNNQKKPLTYQEAIKSGEIDKIKAENNNARKKITPIKNRSEKEPVTYQQFLKDSNGTSKALDTTKNSGSQGDRNQNRKPAESRTNSKYTPRENPIKDMDSAKKRSKLVENLGRELNQRERAELDLYGEILDDKTRTQMDLITSGTDLAGF